MVTRAAFSFACKLKYNTDSGAGGNRGAVQDGGTKRPLPNRGLRCFAQDAISANQAQIRYRPVLVDGGKEFDRAFDVICFCQGRICGSDFANHPQFAEGHRNRMRFG